MRIAVNIDGQFGPMTGIQHYVDGLLGALSAQDAAHEITAFAPSLGVRDLIPAGDSGDRPPDGRSPLWARGVRSLRLRAAQWRAGAASRRYDLLHTPCPTYLRFEEFGTKHNVVTIYDLTTRIFPQAHTAGNIAAWERLFDHAQKRCSGVLAISEATRRDIVEHLGIPEERVQVTPLAPRAGTVRIEDGSLLNESLAVWGLTGTPFVLYAGTLEPRKNLERVVKAFARVAREAPARAHRLVLAGGSWGRFDEHLHRMAQEEGVGERLVTTGYVTDQQMNALMSACAVFVYVSRYEGFGMPPLEAMVCGAPVITSDVSSLPEVVGEAGLQVPPDDTEAIAAALHRLLTDGAENARRRALSVARAGQFTWARTARLTLRAYEAAVSG